MNDNRYDVIIAGAGIGGTCAAIALAKQGIKVLLIEAGEFPRHKVCGEFLSPESKAVFARLQMLEALRSAGARDVQRTRVIANQTQMETALPQAALALSRFRLDEILQQAARSAGTKVLCKTRVRRVEHQHSCFDVETSSGHFHAQAVLAATGRQTSWLPQRPMQTAPVRYVGLKAHFQGANLADGIVELHAWRGGYCGLVQIENGLTNVCLLARYDNLAGRSPEVFWQQLLQEMPSLRKRLHGAQPQMSWLSTGNVTFGNHAATRQEVLCCGDTAGFIHPLTGDGMAMAARSGELAAATLIAHHRGDIDWQSALKIHSAAWQREFASRLQWAAHFQRSLLDPQLAVPALNLLARVPVLSQWAFAKTRGKI
jgi:flavin-dependent dehydrogenase